MTRPAACASEFEDTQGTIGVLGRDLTIVRFATERDVLVEPVLTRAYIESNKHLLALHLVRSVQVRDGPIDGLHHLARSDEVLLQNLPMRLQGVNLFEIGPAQGSLDLSQIESHLAVKEDLLQHQQLGLFVKSVAVSSVKCRLQQARLIVEMKRSYAGTGHCGHLLDCIGHGFFEEDDRGLRASTAFSGMTSVRVKRKKQTILRSLALRREAF